MRRVIGAHLAEQRSLAIPQRSFHASSKAVVKVSGPRMAGLEMPVALVYRGEPLVPAAKGPLTFGSRPEAGIPGFLFLPSIFGWLHI